jgi:hypothetical protein
MDILFPSMPYASWRRHQGADDGKEAFTCTPGRRFFLVFFYYFSIFQNFQTRLKGQGVVAILLISSEIKIFRRRREEFNNNNNNNNN